MTAVAMDIFGPQAFYGSIGVMLSSVVVFTLWRSTQRAEVAPGEQGDFVVMATSPLSVSLNPDVELAEMEAAAVVDAEDIQNSFKELVDELSSPDAVISGEKI